MKPRERIPCSHDQVIPGHNAPLNVKPCDRVGCENKAQYRIDVGDQTMYLCGPHVDEAQATNPSRFIQ